MRMPELPPPRGVLRRPNLTKDPKHAKNRVGPILGEDLNPGGARWCEKHQRLECVHKARPKADGDQTCHRNAIRGTDCCSKHPGNQGAQAMKMKGEAQITAWSAVTQDGKVKPGVHVDPGQAVLAMLQMAWFRAGAYAELLRQQVTKEAGERRALEAATIDEDGEPIGQEMSVNGLIGHKMSATNDGSLYATSEEVRALVVLESQERDRIVAYAEKAHKMGITERMTSMAEKWTDVVAGRVVNMLAELDLTPEQQAKVPMLVQMHLTAIDVSGSEQP